MIEYHINVLQDGSNVQRLYVVQSAQPIDAQLLRVAALLLDSGYSGEEVLAMDVTAASYVNVAATTSTDSIGTCEACGKPILDGQKYNFDRDGIRWHAETCP